MKSEIIQFVWLLVVPALVGLMFNGVRTNTLKIFDNRPIRPPLEETGHSGNGGPTAVNVVEDFKLEDLRALLEKGQAVIIDARKPENFLEGHLVTAINIPSTQIFRPETINKVKGLISPADQIVIYCGGKDCNASKEVYEFLIRLEYPATNIRIFKQGWELLGKTDLPKSVGEE